MSLPPKNTTSAESGKIVFDLPITNNYEPLTTRNKETTFTIEVSNFSNIHPHAYMTVTVEGRNRIEVSMDRKNSVQTLIGTKVIITVHETAPAKTLNISLSWKPTE